VNMTSSPGRDNTLSSSFLQQQQRQQLEHNAEENNFENNESDFLPEDEAEEGANGDGDGYRVSISGNIVGVTGDNDNPGKDDCKTS